MYQKCKFAMTNDISLIRTQFYVVSQCGKNALETRKKRSRQLDRVHLCESRVKA